MQDLKPLVRFEDPNEMPVPVYFGLYWTFLNDMTILLAIVAKSLATIPCNMPIFLVAVSLNFRQVSVNEVK